MPQPTICVALPTSKNLFLATYGPTPCQRPLNHLNDNFFHETIWQH